MKKKQGFEGERLSPLHCLKYLVHFLQFLSELEKGELISEKQITATGLG